MLYKSSIRPSALPPPPPPQPSVDRPSSDYALRVQLTPCYPCSVSRRTAIRTLTSQRTPRVHFSQCMPPQGNPFRQPGRFVQDSTPLIRHPFSHCGSYTKGPPIQVQSANKARAPLHPFYERLSSIVHTLVPCAPVHIQTHHVRQQTTRH